MKKFFLITGIIVVLLAACGDKDEVASTTAVNTFYSLINQYPTSPWAWLASAGLEPVEQ